MFLAQTTYRTGKEFYLAGAVGLAVLPHRGLALRWKGIYDANPVIYIRLGKRDALSNTHCGYFLHGSDHGVTGLSGRLESIRGTVPEHYDRIKGCRFADRCPYREEACEKPQAETFTGPGHMVRCWKKEAL